MPNRIVFFCLMALYLLFTAWVYTRGTTGPAAALLSDTKSTSGKIIYQQYNCTACHQLFGLGGYIGPELTRVISNPAKGEAYVRAILKTGTARMPDLHLDEGQIDDLVSYLRHVDNTAHART